MILLESNPIKIYNRNVNKNLKNNYTSVYYQDKSTFFIYYLEKHVMCYHLVYNQDNV